MRCRGGAQGRNWNSRQSRSGKRLGRNTDAKQLDAFPPEKALERRDGTGIQDSPGAGSAWEGIQMRSSWMPSRLKRRWSAGTELE